MDLRLAGKSALVTGASSGIGAAAAELFAAEGADVVVGYGNNARGARETADRVRATGRRAWLLQMDIAAPDSVRAGIERLRNDTPRIDVLVLNAGQNIVTPVDELSPEEWDHVLRVNLGGPFHVAQQVRPLMPAGSSVVCVASVAGSTGAPHHAHYAAAKAGLMNLTKSLARAWAPDIRVNCVSPGMTLTPMGRDTADKLDPDYARKKLLSERFAEPVEIARCIVFLASDAASFVWGACLDANGGRDLR